MNFSSGDILILRELAAWYRRNKGKDTGRNRHRISRVVGSKTESQVWLFTVLNPTDAGNKDDENTFRYDVALSSDPSTPILENVSPIATPHLHQRHGPGKCKPAQSGSGYQNSSGDWVIADCNEKLLTKGCNAEETEATGSCDTSSGCTTTTESECTALGGTFDANVECPPPPV